MLCIDCAVRVSRRCVAAPLCVQSRACCLAERYVFIAVASRQSSGRRGQPVRVRKELTDFIGRQPADVWLREADRLQENYGDADAVEILRMD